MNENDSEILAGILEAKGYLPASDAKYADIVLTNTCSVRDGAERKANGFIYYLNKLKQQNKNLTIGIVGCMAERMKEEILKKFKFVDFVLGPREEGKLGMVLDALTPVSPDKSYYGSTSPLPQGEGGPRASKASRGVGEGIQKKSIKQRTYRQIIVCTLNCFCKQRSNG